VLTNKNENCIRLFAFSAVFFGGTQAAALETTNLWFPKSLYRVQDYSPAFFTGNHLMVLRPPSPLV
jgi:hypothetical protein